VTAAADRLKAHGPGGFVGLGVSRDGAAAGRLVEWRGGGNAMSTSTYEQVVEQVKTLSALEQERLRDLLNAMLAPPGPMTEEEFEQQMMKEGLLDVPKEPMDSATFNSFKPIDVKGGRLVSDTLLEERR
jgi:hypothetical protein